MSPAALARRNARSLLGCAASLLATAACSGDVLSSLATDAQVTGGPDAGAAAADAGVPLVPPDASEPVPTPDASTPGGSDASQPRADAGSTPGNVLSPASGSDNQDQITAALAAGGVVHLSAGTYLISDTITLSSNSTLEGDRGAIIKLVDDANWPINKPMLGGSNVSNVRITGFEIDGNRANNTTSNSAATACGKYYYTMIFFTSSTGVEVDHMYLHHNWNDIFKVTHSSTVSFHDNTVRQPGHDVVYAIHDDQVQVFNNLIRIYCNSGVRPDSTTNIFIYDNDITRDVGAGGYAGIEIQGDSTVWACDNTIYDCNGGDIANLSGVTVNTTGCPTPGAPEYPQVP